MARTKPTAREVRMDRLFRYAKRSSERMPTRKYDYWYRLLMVLFPNLLSYYPDPLSVPSIARRHIHRIAVFTLKDAQALRDAALREGIVYTPCSSDLVNLARALGVWMRHCQSMKENRALNNHLNERFFEGKNIDRLDIPRHPWHWWN